MREQTVAGSLLVFFTLPSAAAQETPRLAPCMCANGRTDMSRDVLPRALTESRHGSAGTAGLGAQLQGWKGKDGWRLCRELWTSAA